MILFLLMPKLLVIALYLAAALLPAFFLARYVYRLDGIEKEPMGLLWRLLLCGAAAGLLSGVAEKIGSGLLSRFISLTSPAGRVLFAFLVVAAVEEGFKFLFLRKLTWKQAAFNYRFDGIVYSVFVSMGFAALENLLYLIGYGLSAAPQRALLAVPAHMGFAVFMGFFYGNAKSLDSRGVSDSALISLAMAYLSAVVQHGFYDACILVGSTVSTVLFFLFIAVMVYAVVRILRRGRRNDQSV